MDTLHCPQYKYYINVFPLRHLGSRKHSFDFTGLCASLCNQSMHRVLLNAKQADPVFNKISGTINKTYLPKMYCMKSQQIHRAWKGCVSQHCRICQILANRPKLAAMPSKALPCPICQNFMQYIFGILEAYYSTLGTFYFCHLKFY